MKSVYQKWTLPIVLAFTLACGNGDAKPADPGQDAAPQEPDPVEETVNQKPEQEWTVDEAKVNRIFGSLSEEVQKGYNDKQYLCCTWNHSILRCSGAIDDHVACAKTLIDNGHATAEELSLKEVIPVENENGEVVPFAALD